MLMGPCVLRTLRVRIGPLRNDRPLSKFFNRLFYLVTKSEPREAKPSFRRQHVPIRTRSVRSTLGSEHRAPYHDTMNVCLFDIDGTLLASGGAGKAALELAFSEEFGAPVRHHVPYSGRTD